MGEPPVAAPATFEITTLLAAARAGDRDAFDQAFAAVYGELRTIARHQLRHAAGAATIDTTALVHEAYLKFSRQTQWSMNDRVHFYRLAARAMRNIVIDAARRKDRVRHGGELLRVEMDDALLAPPTRADELVAVDTALAGLEALDPELAELVEWRFFAGLSVDEIATLLGVSDRTVKRRWRAARAYLYTALTTQGVTT